MSKASAESIQHVGQRYEKIMSGLRGFAGGGEGSQQGNAQSELINIIHRPGWTTVQDVALVNASLDAIEQQVKAMEKLHQALVTGARNGLQQSAAA